jgi:hypothetical protein
LQNTVDLWGTSPSTMARGREAHFGTTWLLRSQSDAWIGPLCSRGLIMINTNCDPIGHIPPLRRIDFGQLGQRSAEPVKRAPLDRWAEQERQYEIDRLWWLVVQTTRGHGA